MKEHDRQDSQRLLWVEDLEQQLQRLRERAAFRSLRVPRPGVVDFTSNDYLGLNTAGKIHEMYRMVINSYRGHIGSTGSRLLSGHYEEFDAAEKKFSHFTGHRASLLFQSGYAANTGAISALMGPGDTILADRLCHASIIDGIRLSGAKKRFFQHNDLKDLKEKLVKVRAQTERRVWVIVESVYSLDGDIAPLTDICDAAEEQGALVYVDEAHSIGVMGSEGQGLVGSQGLQERVAVTTYPMGKAPGLMGAFVCGPGVLRETLINNARSFIFSTAQPPFLAMLLEKIISYLGGPHASRMRRNLTANTDLFRSELRSAGVEPPDVAGHIIPVIVGEEKAAVDLAHHCQDRGFDVRAIRPPAVPRGYSRLRISIHATHKQDDLQALARLLGEQLS